MRSPSKAKRTELYWSGLRDALVTGCTAVDQHKQEHREYYRDGFADGLKAVNRIRRRKA